MSVHYNPKKHVGVLVFKSVAILYDGYCFVVVVVVLSLDFQAVSHQFSHLYKPVSNYVNTITNAFTNNIEVTPYSGVVKKWSHEPS